MFHNYLIRVSACTQLTKKLGGVKKGNRNKILQTTFLKPTLYNPIVKVILGAVISDLTSIEFEGYGIRGGIGGT
jgi:hypothetical protein